MILEKDIKSILHRESIPISKGTIMTQITAVLMFCVSIYCLYMELFTKKAALDGKSYLLLIILGTLLFFSIRAINRLTTATIQYDRIVGKSLFGKTEVLLEDITDFDTFKYKRKTYLIIKCNKEGKTKTLWISPKIFTDFYSNIIGEACSDAYDVLFYAIEYKNKDINTFNAIISGLRNDEVTYAAA